MTDANTLRRLNYLWKNRHKHDDEVALQSDLVIIREQVEGSSDSTPWRTEPAYIHLTRNATQTIAVSGEEVSWDKLHPLIDPIGFTHSDADLPLTEVTIPYEAYYGVKFESKWVSHTSGGTVEIRRERNSNTVRLWPTDDDPDLWTSTDGQKFTGLAVIPCKVGDKVSVFLDHDDAATKDLAKAQLIVWKIESSDIRQFYKEVVLAAGPLAYWRLDEPSGTNAADIAGHSSGPFDATITGPTLSVDGVMQDGSGNTAMDFDGSSDTVLGSDWAAMDFANKEPFSLEAWINTDTVAAGSAIIIHKQIAGSGNGWELVRNGSTVFAGRVGAAGSHGAVSASGSLSVDTDHYVAVTYDGTDLKLYLDGVLVDIDSTAVDMTANTISVEIGFDTPSSGGPFDGQIDEVAVYDRALSAAEINEHYNVGRGVS